MVVYQILKNAFISVHLGKWEINQNLFGILSTIIDNLAETGCFDFLRANHEYRISHVWLIQALFTALESIDKERKLNSSCSIVQLRVRNNNDEFSANFLTRLSRKILTYIPEDFMDNEEIPFALALCLYHCGLTQNTEFNSNNFIQKIAPCCLKLNSGFCLTKYVILLVPPSRIDLVLNRLIDSDVNLNEVTEVSLYYAEKLCSSLSILGDIFSDMPRKVWNHSRLQIPLSPLLIACAAGKVEIAKKLMDVGAYINPV